MKKRVVTTTKKKKKKKKKKRAGYPNVPRVPKKSATSGNTNASNQNMSVQFFFDMSVVPRR